MKKLLLLFFIIPFLSFAQENIATFSGKVENQQNDFIEFVSNEYFVGDAEQIDKAKIVDGKFKYSFSIDETKWIIVRHNGQALEFYVEPGNDIKINFNGKNLYGAEVSGKGAANTKFWNAFQTACLSNNDEALNSAEKFMNFSLGSNLSEKMKSVGIDEWEMFLFGKLQEFKKFFKENQTEYAISFGFEKYLKNYWNNFYLANLMAFPIENANASASKIVNRLPEVMLDVLSDDKIDNPNAFNDEEYRSFVEYFVRYKAVEANNFQKFEDRSDWLRKQLRVAETYLTGKPLQYVLAKTLLAFGEEASPATARQLFKTMRLVQENDYEKIVEQKLSEHLNKTEEIASSNKENILAEIEKDRKKMKENDGKFRMLDMEGNKVAVEDFIGKVVYLDVWASWCGPCIGQIPHAKKLKEKFTEEQLEQIVFLYINIDNTEKKWKDAVEKHDIKGFHLFSPGGWDSEVTKQYGVRSIPRFMLIDKNGTLKQAEAKRPSDPALYEDLLVLINQEGPKIKNADKKKSSKKKKKKKDKKKK